MIKLTTFAILAYGLIFVFSDLNVTYKEMEIAPVGVNEVINKNTIEAKLDPSEAEVFENEDISDHADVKVTMADRVIWKFMLNNDFRYIRSAKDLEIYNVNTEEFLDIVISVNGKLIPKSLDVLDEFMRDWRKNQVVDIDPDLYVLMADLHDEVDAEGPIHLLSGHRSQYTNDLLRKQGVKTAKKSQHLLGRAADITIPEVPVNELREEALAMEKGGVGYYPKNHFIHVDTGPIRRW